MDENAVSNITQVLVSFDNFVSILENTEWYKSATPEDIKNGFKLGLFLEKCISHFQTENFISEFFNVLTQWWKTKNRTKVYDVPFFEFACDRLLTRFFQCEDTSEISLEVAIRVYTSVFPRRRLKCVIRDLILTSSSHEAISDFTKANMTKNDSSDLEYSLVVNSWSNVLQSGRESDVHNIIDTKLSLYKIESSLHLLVGILSLRNVTGSGKSLQNIVLEKVLQKMLDRSVLSKSFWLTVFKKIQLLYICRACENFEKFLVSVFSFVVYIGSMMKSEDGVWRSDETVSLCPEITYQEIVGLVKGISDTNYFLKSFVCQKLKEAQENTDSLIWEKIRQDIET